MTKLKRFCLVSIFIFLTIFIFLPKSFAALYINEFSSDTEGTISDPDWIEIYNSGPDSVDLSVYRLRDSTVTNKKDLNGIIGVDSFEVFDWSNKLNKSGDIIKLLLISDESIIDQMGYGDQGNDVFTPSVGQSAGRQPNGSNSWTVFATSTKKSSNNTSSPAPTSTPSLTPIPSPTPKPTKITSTKTTASSPTPTQKILVSPSQGKILSAATSTKVSIPTSVLGKSTESAAVTLPPTTIGSNKEVKTLGSNQNNIFKILIGVGGIFIVSCAILLFRYSKDRKISNE